MDLEERRVPFIFEMIFHPYIQPVEKKIFFACPEPARSTRLMSASGVLRCSSTTMPAVWLWLCARRGEMSLMWRAVPQ